VDEEDVDEMQEVTFEYYYATHPTTVATPRLPVGRLADELTMDATTADREVGGCPVKALELRFAAAPVKSSRASPPHRPREDGFTPLCRRFKIQPFC
jgi:hypothetical protein